MNAKALSDIRRKRRILDYGKQLRNVSKACRHFGVSWETYCKWKRDYERAGEKALVNSRPCPQNPKIRVPGQVEDLILHLRTTYHLGQRRISGYLKRYYNIKVSQSGVYSVLKRNGLNKRGQNQRKRSLLPFKRYEKQVPGHRIQMDVKFLYVKDILTLAVR